MEDKKTWRQSGKDVVWSAVTYLATATVGALAALFGIQPQQIIQHQVELIAANTVTGNDGVVRATGWDYDPVAIESVVASIPNPVFATTAAGSVAANDLPDKAYLWEFSKIATGKHIPARDQKSVGSCVAFGAITAIEYLAVIQIADRIKKGLPPTEFRSLSQEVMYGFARHQIGKDALRNKGDGAVGAWAAKAANEYGVVVRDKYTGYDLSEYSERLCRQFGETGPPSIFLPIAKEHLVKSISPIKTTDELMKALANKYPVSTASSVGFGNRGPYVRDADGILYASGSWNHQQMFCGYTTHPTKGVLFYVENSWGSQWISGPTGAGDPPSGGYYVTKATAQKMLDGGDSWAFSNLVDWNVQLDWFVKLPRKLNNNLLNLLCKI